MIAIAQALTHLKERIAKAEALSGRPPGSVTLIAVSKGQPVEAIRYAYAAGQRCFGENYVQEAMIKLPQLADLAIEWHFIGGIQSNKTRAIATQFHWVHSVDRLAIAERLSAQRPCHLPPLNLCLQLNLGHEPQKGGMSESQVFEVATQITRLPGMRLRGLMTLPARADSGAGIAEFERLASIFNGLRQQGIPLDVLSMGMSDDFEAAIAAGATHLRIGTALFGERIKGVRQ